MIGGVQKDCPVCPNNKMEFNTANNYWYCRGCSTEFKLTKLEKYFIKLGKIKGKVK